MFKRSLLPALVGLSVMSFAAGTASSAALQKKELSAEEIKKRVENFGVGVTARVQVKLRNGTKMKGFIDSVGDDHFYLIRTDDQTGTSAIVAYSDVVQIEGKKSFVDWRKIAYRAGTGAGVVLSILRNLRLQGPRIGPRFHH
jgi:hypothetical protein